MKSFKTKVTILLSFIMISVAGAIEVDMTPIGFPIETIDIHGFFSQGYMKSSSNDVFGKTTDGTIDLREFGINFSGNLTEELMLAAQLTGYTLGEQGGDNIIVHYALADYHLADVFGIRAGRVRVATGLYNETRDIDILRTSVFLPQSIYPEVYRDYYASADAAAIYGTFNLDSLGYLSYQAHTGKLVNDEDPLSDLPYSLGGLGFSNIRLENGRSSGAQVIWDTPADGLRCGWTWRRIDNTAWCEVGGTDVEITVNNYVNQVWSVEYQIDRLTLMSEYGYMTLDGAPDNTSWYAGFNYEINDKLSVGSNYSSFSGERGSFTDPDLLSGYERTVSMYSKYNITDSWLIKGQIDMSRGTGRNQNASMATDDEVANTLFSIKTSWSF